MKNNILESKEIVESLAEQVHVTWMEGRIKDGWTYGAVRDDVHKKTPCIVPYNELPESEKEYDRNTVRTTVKALYSLGFCISKDDSKDISSDNSGDGLP